ncbi:hypothetical protein BN946_scf184844.g79, partial [Trametes cinnabarina]
MSVSTRPALVVQLSDNKQDISHVEAEIVVFRPHDPDDPTQWPSRKKQITVALVCIYAFCAVFGSAVYAPGEEKIRERFGVNADVSSTGLTMYVLGFGFAPLISPLTEHLGRKLPYYFSWVLLVVSSALSAFIENIVVVLLCAAACALNTGPGVVADLYAKDLHALGHGEPVHRLFHDAATHYWYHGFKATTMFAFCALSGPCFATLFGFFIAAHTTNA